MAKCGVDDDDDDPMIFNDDVVDSEWCIVAMSHTLSQSFLDRPSSVHPSGEWFAYFLLACYSVKPILVLHPLKSNTKIDQMLAKSNGCEYFPSGKNPFSYGTRFAEVHNFHFRQVGSTVNI